MKKQNTTIIYYNKQMRCKIGKFSHKHMQMCWFNPELIRASYGNSI